MGQIFKRRTDGVFRSALIILGVVSVLGLTIAVCLPRSDFFTGVDYAVAQPVPFSHKHHVGELGIDCRYCHNGVETSASAGLPATEVCMTCHSQLFTSAPMLEPVRQSLATGEPLRWRRVHDLADYVYFNHSIHVAKGVACETCHGAVDEMPLIAKAHTLTMSWCLDCHRDPEPNLRAPKDVFSMHWNPPKDIAEIRSELIRVLHIDTDTMTDCYVCHR